MELSSIFIGVGIFLLFMLPIVYMIITQKKKAKAKTLKLYEISGNNNLNLEMVETTDMVVLGLDVNALKLIIVEPMNNANFGVIDLQEITSCKVKTISAVQKENRYLYVALELFEKATGKKSFEIVYYDDDVDLNLAPEAELLRAKKWQGTINAHLKEVK